jgi:nucleoside-diphosphate-sugar epimerase
MKTLLFTGSNGFLGQNVLPLLRGEYQVSTLDLQNANIECNLLAQTFETTESFDIVLHAAGKAHVVPKDETEKQAFFDINLQGTVNLCTSLENSQKIPKSFVFISTVAVYGREFGEDITEDEPLNGTTPYAKSKIMAETFLINWCRNNDVTLSILRPSLLAGINPPGNLGAMIKGIKTGRYLSFDDGKARKSILMVQDIARLIPLLENKGGIYNVCSDEHPSFRELEKLMITQLNKSSVLEIPLWVAQFLAKTGNLLGRRAPINSEKLSKIIQSLTFSNEKAKKELNWQPLSILKNFRIK